MKIDKKLQMTKAIKKNGVPRSNLRNICRRRAGRLPTHYRTIFATISTKFFSIYVPLFITIGMPLFVEMRMLSSS